MPKNVPVPFQPFRAASRCRFDRFALCSGKPSRRRLAAPALLAVMALLAPPAGAQEEPGPIQDNSFLVEEAYNQEAGVVQHIQTFSRARRGGAWLYTFTQEWPVVSQRHQFSYTLPWESLGDEGADGAGDVAINYRLQLLGSGEAPIALSPRFSLLLPTGDEEEGLGTGALGVQVNLPLSVELGRRAVTHVNVGATYVPDASNAAGDEADLDAYNFGQSFIWLLRPRFNLMLELAYASEEEVAGRGLVERGESFFVNPGIRWAHDLPNGLQIVPGLAVSIGTGPSSGERAYFFYLSLEHAFRNPG